MNAVSVCREDRGESLYPDAAASGSSPEVEATKDAAEGILGIRIPYYVFVDMKGFANLVDALGGVKINATQRLPKGGPPPGSGAHDVDSWAIGWIEPGEQVMNGDTAQWYARSRYTTSDWDRMKRQRQLQEAILAQFTPQNVLTRFNEVAAAGTALVETDLPQDKLPEFFDLMLKAKEQTVTTIELTPGARRGGARHGLRIRARSDPARRCIRRRPRRRPHPDRGESPPALVGPCPGGSLSLSKGPGDRGISRVRDTARRSPPGRQRWWPWASGWCHRAHRTTVIGGGGDHRRPADRR